MKIISNTSITKKLIIAIIVVLLFNCFVPFTINASEDAEVSNTTEETTDTTEDDDDIEGGDLFNPIAELFCTIGDLVIQALQKIFLGFSEIESGGSYQIYYAPKNIFSGVIPTFDINFIEPKETYEFSVTIEPDPNDTTDNPYDDFRQYLSEATVLKEYGEIEGTNEEISNRTGEIWEEVEATYDVDEASFTNGGIGGSLTDSYYCWSSGSNSTIVLSIVDTDNSRTFKLYQFSVSQDSFILAARNAAYDFTDGEDEETKTVQTSIKSSAAVLQPIIATWYTILRLIALVGLLSVLVYIGIRIVISSSSQEKAKYKKMIIDWVAAICILFILQFIMVIIIQIAESVTQMLLPDASSAQINPDNLMSNIRNQVNTRGLLNGFGHMIIYLALVIYTCMFTIIYLKRLLYMAFLTMIAPLIALTYPLDRIKDGQAQAFTTWIREYTFNALLQVIHLLLYTILIDSAQTLIDQGNLIYALVAIGFLIPAEKFIRKMFGFEKAGTISPMGAAAGGAVVMNAINKLKGKNGGSGSQSSDNGDGKKEQGKTRTAGGENKMDNSTQAWTDTTSLDTAYQQQVRQEESARDVIDAAGDKGEQSRLDKIKAWGASHIAEPYKNSKVINGIKELGSQKFTGKKIAKFMATKTLQATAGATLGAIGIAAGIATGNVGNALQYGIGGITAGSAIGKGIPK